jgi:ankyrin repeat protein
MGCCNEGEAKMLLVEERKSFSSQQYQFEVYAAIKKGKLEELKEYIGSKFDPSYKMPAFLGRSPMHIAAEYGRVDILFFLLDQGADVNSLDCSGCPPIFMAMKEGHLDLVEKMIHAGAEIKIINHMGLKLHDYIKPSLSNKSMILLKNNKYFRQQIKAN